MDSEERKRQRRSSFSRQCVAWMPVWLIVVGIVIFAYTDPGASPIRVAIGFAIGIGIVIADIVLEHRRP